MTPQEAEDCAIEIVRSILDRQDDYRSIRRHYPSRHRRRRTRTEQHGGSEMIDRFFVYDGFAHDGFQTFSTAESRDAAAKTTIAKYQTGDGWMEDVLDIKVGVITGVAAKANVERRPDELDENGEDEDGNYWPPYVQEKCDVEIQPVGFSPDWDLLEATQESLREHMAALKAAQASEQAVRAQLHTEIEQRQSLANMIENMPHAQIQRELEEFRAKVAAALDALRAGYTQRSDGEGASIPWRAATDLARQELDATIAALGFGNTDADHAPDCLCAWCKVDRDNKRHD